MRYYNPEENNEESNEEVEGFFEKEDQNVAMELIDMTRLNFEVMRLAVQISSNSFFWRFYSNKTKLKIVEETYIHLNSILG